MELSKFNIQNYSVISNENAALPSIRKSLKVFDMYQIIHFSAAKPPVPKNSLSVKSVWKVTAHNQRKCNVGIVGGAIQLGCKYYALLPC